MKNNLHFVFFSILTLGAARAAVVTVSNPSFESNGIAAGGFVNATPTSWTRIAPTNTTVGIIGEDRANTMNTTDGIAWAHLQTDETNPTVNIPYLGQSLGAVTNALFTGPDDQLEIEFLVAKRTNGDRNVHLTVSLYAATGADWTAGGTLISSAVFQTTLASLAETSISSGSVTLNLGNPAAQSHGGNYWLVFANTQSSFTPTTVNAGTLDSSAQLQLDSIAVNTIPEPTTTLLGCVGLLSLLRRRR